MDNLKNAISGSKIAVKVSSIGAGQAIAIGMVVITLAQVLAGGDDLLGILTDIRETPHAGTYPDNTHVLLRENGDLRGRATINVFSTGRYSTIWGPSQALPGDVATYYGGAAGAGGTLTYTWTVSGPDGPTVVQSGPTSYLDYSNSNEGTYSIGVSVTDSYGSVGGSSMELTIRNCGGPNQPGCG